MRIQHSNGTRAIVTLSRNSAWTDTRADGPALDTERRRVRAAAAEWAWRRGYGGYEVYASKSAGGYTVDVVDFEVCDDY